MKKEKPTTPPSQPPKSPGRRSYDRMKVISMLTLVILTSFQAGAEKLPIWAAIAIIICASLVGAEYKPDEDDDDDGDGEAVPVAK